MAYDFSANEIFNMAVRIEANGARFYRRAAELQSDESNKQMLTKLATMEDRHKSIFEKLRSALSASEKAATVFDPNGETAQYLAAMADSHGGEGSPEAADALTGKESLKEIIQTAIGLEKESILFYLGKSDYSEAESCLTVV